MTRRDFLRAATAASGLAACAGAARSADAERPRRPNVLFILADDLGWMDTAVYGSRYYKTPHIDRLAQRGMRFTSAYAANPLCSPTRASILTGKYPGRLRITTPEGHLPPEPEDKPWLPASAPAWMKMVPPRSRRFLPLGERTLAETFRQAGYATAFIGKWHLGPEEFWPDKQGFDVNVAGGHYPGPPSYFSPHRIQTLRDGPKGEYLADRLTDEAVACIKAHKRKAPDQPFLMCLWHYSVHAPFQARQDLVEPYRGLKDPRGQQNCPVMGGMIASLDASVGRLLDTLDEQGLSQDTIIVFTSDNGGNMYNRVEGATPTSNAPLRSGKGNLYEGGVREPAIVVAPGVTRPGSVCDHAISSIDYYPTLLDLANLSAPPVDGASFVPLLRGQAPQAPREIYCYFPHYIPATGNRPGVSVRQGDWKLYRFFGEGPDRGDRHELYNLKDDIGETTDQAGRMGQKVRELDALISAHLQAIDAVVPVKNPAYDPQAADPMKGQAESRPAPARPVMGWRAAGTCDLKAEKDLLAVQSTGGDPHLYAELPQPAQGAARARVRMRLAGRGEGQFYWTTPKAPHFARERTVFFDLQHDNQWHEYFAPLAVQGDLTGLRLDPGSAPGRIEIQWIRLEKADGTVLREWDFSRPPGRE